MKATAKLVYPAPFTGATTAGRAGQAVLLKPHKIVHRGPFLRQTTGPTPSLTVITYQPASDQPLAPSEK